MAFIVTSILKSTVGLLLNKARNKAADKLKDGDITDAKIREIIIRELNDVKTKLDGLSRTYLLTSYNFLQEGVNLLKACLDLSERKQKAILNETQGDGGETSIKPSDPDSRILTEAIALSQAMDRVKINADREFELAKERFKDARKEATRAFYNEALNVKDRILAAKLRIVSELLESLESPETAIINCLPFLEKLNSLPAIREIFSVYINGGYKSKLNKAERVENVVYVMLINYVLFQYVSEFSSKYCSAITWPTIELDDHSFHPILDWQEVSTRRSWSEELIQPPNEVILNEEIDHVFCAVNSHGEIIVRALGGNINVTSRKGEVKMVTLNYPADGEIIKQYIAGLAVDNTNNIYVLMHLRKRTESRVMKSYVLYVFDENYNAKKNCILQFLYARFGVRARIAINKKNNILINMHNYPHVYVCDSAGQLKHKFRRDTSNVRTLATSDKDEILLESHNLEAVHRYTEKGDLVSTIKVPEGHEIPGVAFHYVICRIMILTFIEKTKSHFLLRYSETGELENSTFLFTKDIVKYPVITSHPSGPVVVLRERSITFI